MITIKDWTTENGDTVEVYASSGEYRWHVKAANGEVVGQGEGHPHARDAIRAAERHHPPVPSEA